MATRTCTGTSPSCGARRPARPATSRRPSPWPNAPSRSATARPTPDLKAYAQSNLGALKIASGETSDGFALMEEASIAAVNGELSPFTTGVTACRMIGACRDMTDYRRASEWIEATERYCDRQSLSGFPGVCRIHRAEVAAVGGAWERAEQELERATGELGAFNAVPPQADGFYAIGDIRRLRGDFEGAEAALREAHARGRSPQPALALVRLAEGKIKAAAAAINGGGGRGDLGSLGPGTPPAGPGRDRDRGWRGRTGADRDRRARSDRHGLPVTGARGGSTGRAGPRARGRGRRGRRRPASCGPGSAAGARSVRRTRSPVRGPSWRARFGPSTTRTTRDLELQAALDEFRRLGARIDVEAAERELRDAEDRRSGPATTHKTFMFTDIVGSTNLAEALGDQAWERLLRWHDDVLRSQIASGGGEIVNSTGDGFFAAFESAQSGVDCASSIQRALADHRDSTGFALSVRIGLHTAEANRRGSDYSGKGVHVAARVAALAGGGEILATAETLAEAGSVRASEARSTPIRGVGVPMQVATVIWE